MQMQEILTVACAAIGAAFFTIVVRKAAAGLWFLTVAVARGLYWLSIGWWVARLRRFVEHGF